MPHDGRCAREAPTGRKMTLMRAGTRMRAAPTPRARERRQAASRAAANTIFSAIFSSPPISRIGRAFMP